MEIDRFRERHGLTYNKKNKVFNDYNTKGFKEMLKYLINLKEDGTLSEEQYFKLLELTCSIYIENKVQYFVTEKFDEILNDKMLNRLYIFSNIEG